MRENGRKGDMELKEYLEGNGYPGRFLLGGTGKDGEQVLAYAIMGRSEHSRNRIFKRCDGGFRTVPWNESLVKDPSLIIYRALRETEKSVILTNGDQSDTIYDALSHGKTLEDALLKRTYEPDGPNWTPRISLVMDKGSGAYTLSILRKDGDETARIIHAYPARKGYCHVIHTYLGDGNPLPSFQGEPPLFAIPSNLDDLSRLLWDNLDPDNKISLFVRYGAEDTIINKKEETQCATY